MQTAKKIFRISCIFPCLLCMMAPLPAQAFGTFLCDFVDLYSCKWTYESSADFYWRRHSGHQALSKTGPTTDHTRGVGLLANKTRGPGSIQHRGRKCIRILGAAYNRPKDGQSLVVNEGCWEGQQEFQLWPNGTLMLTRHGMCVRPDVTETLTVGVRVGVFSICDATDKWSWTAQGSLKYKKNMCLKPETGGINPDSNVVLVLDSVCDESQNFFQFVPTFLANENQGPGSIRHRGYKCIHVSGAAYIRPKEGQPLVVYQICGEEQTEFQLWPNGTLMLTRHGMCVKPKATGPVTEGVQVGVLSICNATDKWSWTDQGSLQYKKSMCLKPQTGGTEPDNDVMLVLDSVCDKSQNFFQFVPTLGWYLFILTSSGQSNDTALLISPSTTKVKSCLCFYYHMYGRDVNKLQVYVKSGGKMGLPVWSRYGNHGDKWYQAQVAVNNQMRSYQYVIEGVRGNGPEGDIAIDDISLMDSCTTTENLSSKLTSSSVDDNNGSNTVAATSTVSTTKAFLASQTAFFSEENQPSKSTSVENNGSKRMATTSTVYSTSSILTSQTICCTEGKEKTDKPSRIILIATTVGAGVLLIIVLVVFMIKYKRRNRPPILSTPINIPLGEHTIPQEQLPVNEEPVYETIPNIHREFYYDVTTNADEFEDRSAEDRASIDKEVAVPSNAREAFGYSDHAVLKQDTGNVMPEEDTEYEIPIPVENIGYVMAIPEEDIEYVMPISEEDTEYVMPISEEDIEYVIPISDKEIGYVIPLQGQDIEQVIPIPEEDTKHVVPISEKPQNETLGLNETCK